MCERDFNALNCAFCDETYKTCTKQLGWYLFQLLPEVCVKHMATHPMLIPLNGQTIRIPLWWMLGGLFKGKNVGVQYESSFKDNTSYWNPVGGVNQEKRTQLYKPKWSKGQMFWTWV